MSIGICASFYRYKEYHDLRFEQVMMFCVGLVLVLIGVQIMSQRTVPNGNSSGDDNDKDKKKSKNNREKRERRKNSGDTAAGTGGSDDITNESGRHTTGESRFYDDGVGGRGEEQEDDVVEDEGDEVDEERDVPTEVDSLLGGDYRGTTSPPSTPIHDSHSHLASACSFPGVLIDSAARSVGRRPRRIKNVPPALIEEIHNTNTTRVQQHVVRSTGNVQSSSGVIYAEDDCV